MVRYWFLRVFFLCWTLVVVGYVLMMTLFSQEQKTTLHSSFPALQYTSAFLNLQEYPEWQLRSPQSQERVASTLKLFRLNDLRKNSEELVTFVSEEKNQELTTPVYTFDGAVGTGLVSFVVQYEHKTIQGGISQNLLERVNEQGAWKWDVSLANGLIKQGKNTYIFEAMNTEGKKKTYTKTLQVDYELLVAGETTLFLDPYAKREGKKIVWEEDDFDGIPTSFLTYGCIDPNQKVVIQHNDVYSEIPACLTYSLKKGYLIFFGNRRETSGEYIYTAQSPQHGLVYDKFPLYQWRWGSLYQSLLFFNPGGNFVQIVKATGDIYNYETLIQHYDIRSQRNTMSLRQINGEQVEIENGYEKIILYYYKNNKSRRDVVFPGLRYKYYVMRSGRWKLINQGTVYHLDEKVRVPPVSDTGSVFRLDAWLYGDEVVVEDPFMHITYSITDLKREVRLIQRPKEKFDCDATSLGVYGYHAVQREYVYEHDDISLLGAGRDVPRIRLQDNYGSEYEVEQHTSGYIASTIEPRERGVAGEKILFTVLGLDENGREICKKSVPLSILKTPEW